MATKNMNTNIQKLYSKYNQVRSKLLLFIDNEIQSKIKQNNQNVKFNCASKIEISFEETFTQKQIDKYDFSFSNILKPKKKDSSNKSFSTNDNSSNKITNKSFQKVRGSNHSKILETHPSKIFNDSICINKKFYSIKNLPKQSSTFYILNNQKKAEKYLKTLCNSLKMRKISKPLIHNRSISISTNFFDFSKIKKTKKLNGIKILKSKKDNLYNFLLFRKSLKGNFLSNSKKLISGKSTHSILITN